MEVKNGIGTTVSNWQKMKKSLIQLALMELNWKTRVKPISPWQTEMPELDFGYRIYHYSLSKSQEKMMRLWQLNANELKSYMVKRKSNDEHPNLVN